MMTIRVRLFGTLGRQFPDHDPEHGLTVEIPDGSDADALLIRLGISRARVGMVSSGGRLVRAGEPLSDGAIVRVFQPVFGG